MSPGHTPDALRKYPDATAEALTRASLAPAFAQVFAHSDVRAAEGWLETCSTDLSQLICRPTPSMADVVKAAFNTL